MEWRLVNTDEREGKAALQGLVYISLLQPTTAASGS